MLDTAGHLPQTVYDHSSEPPSQWFTTILLTRTSRQRLFPPFSHPCRCNAALVPMYLLLLCAGLTPACCARLKAITCNPYMDTAQSISAASRQRLSPHPRSQTHHIMAMHWRGGRWLYSSSRAQRRGGQKRAPCEPTAAAALPSGG
jgi:hypothetical protein